MQHGLHNWLQGAILMRLADQVGEEMKGGFRLTHPKALPPPPPQWGGELADAKGSKVVLPQLESASVGGLNGVCCQRPLLGNS